MEHNIEIYFLYFIILAIMGWVMEVTLQLVQKHKFSNRGFLIGPYCPIYGCGGVLITLTLSNLSNHPIALFSTAILICGVLEYLTSYLMEKIFNARWWDYSNNKFNINGRVCLETIIPFGLLGLTLIYIINPFIFGKLNQIPENIVRIIAIIVESIFLIDLIISFYVISNVRKATKKFDKENPKDSTDAISKKVREFLRGKSVLNRRLINAFPELTATLKERKEKIKQKTKEIKGEIVNKANEVKNDLTDKAVEIKEEISQKAGKVKEKIKKDKDK